MRTQFAVIFALCLASVFAVETIPKPALDTGLFTIGFFDGLNTVLSLPPFTPCVAFSFETVQQIESAAKQIATLKPAQVIAGIAQLGAALENVPNVVAGCQGAEADVKLIKESVAIFKNPKYIITELQNLLIHGAQVDTEIHAAIAAERSEDYLALGNAVGQIVGLANLH